MKHIDIAGSGAHSHEEVWNLVHGLPPQLTNLAFDLLPSMKRYKRLIIMIGAASLSGDAEEKVTLLAKELAKVANQTAKVIADNCEKASSDPLIDQIVRETKMLASQANVIALHGVDGEAARSLRVAYRTLRNSCTALWQYEFVPEGNPLPKVAGGRS
jgi:hypothetical protein